MHIVNAHTQTEASAIKNLSYTQEHRKAMFQYTKAYDPYKGIDEYKGID